MATIRASLIAQSPEATEVADDASIAAATDLFARSKWLFARRLLPAWRRTAALLERLDRWKMVIGAVVLTGLAALLVGAFFVRSHSFGHWQAVVAPLAAEAAQVQLKASTAIGQAAAVGVVPLGASVHAEGALIEINKLNGNMRGLIVTSTDPVVLQSTFAEHPDARQVLAHDRGLLRLARQHLALANEELVSATKVRAYGEKWHDLDLYAVLPAGLSPQWSIQAAVMRAALNSGDLQKIEQADRQLVTLEKSGDIARSAESIVGHLSTGDQLAAAPYMTTIRDAAAHGDLDRARAALASLAMMQKQVPLSYSLYLVSIPGEKTFVSRPDARNSSVRLHYLIVQATDEHGAQVPVDIHDSDLGQDVIASRFGVEVSAEIFEQAQNDERDGLLLVGKKLPGTVSTAFALPVLDGRISRW